MEIKYFIQQALCLFGGLILIALPIDFVLRRQQEAEHKRVVLAGTLMTPEEQLKRWQHWDGKSKSWMDLRREARHWKTTYEKHLSSNGLNTQVFLYQLEKTHRKLLNIQEDLKKRQGYCEQITELNYKIAELNDYITQNPNRWTLKVKELKEKISSAINDWIKTYFNDSIERLKFENCTLKSRLLEEKQQVDS